MTNSGLQYHQSLIVNLKFTASEPTISFIVTLPLAEFKWGISMKFINVLSLLLLVPVALTAGILFSIRNTQQVQIDLLLLQLPTASISIYLLLSFLAGALMAGVIYTVLGIQLKVRHRSLQGQLKRLIQTHKQQSQDKQ